MSKAQTDIRTTSYNAATANPHGYVGTLDDALAQVRAEPDEVRAYWPLNISRERYELLNFLGLLKPKDELSGVQKFVRMPVSYVYPKARTRYEDARDRVGDGIPKRDRVEYGAPEHG
jgi:hypothetical protein